jgi:hypothetical protein
VDYIRLVAATISDFQFPSSGKPVHPAAAAEIKWDSTHFATSACVGWLVSFVQCQRDFFACC